MLDFTYKNVTIFSRTNDVSPIEKYYDFPTVDDNAEMVTTFNESNFNFIGGLGLGDNSSALQTNYKVVFDTLSNITIVPSTDCVGCSAPWFNTSLSPDTLISSDAEYSFEILKAKGTCQIMETALTCVAGVVSPSGSDAACVTGLETCLANSVTAENKNGYEAVLGLGMPKVETYFSDGSVGLNTTSVA